MKKITIWVLSFVFVLSLVGCSQKREETTWQEKYDLGVRYLEEGNYEEAIIAFTAAIEIDPKKAPAYVGRGDAYIGSGETEENLAVALEDYETAIELDGTTAEVYKKAAELYVLLGDTDAAVELLRRGIEATGDAELQAYLEELTAFGPLTVLTYQAAYKPDGTLIEYENYYYNDQGYMIQIEETFINDYDGTSRTWIETWTYNTDSDSWLYVPDRNHYEYETDEEWEAAKEECHPRPGTHHEWTGSFGGGYAVCVDPLIWEDQLRSVLENDGILENDGNEEWDYAVYTFDENGLPAAITTYNDNGISGTAVLEWAVIEPVSAHN